MRGPRAPPPRRNLSENAEDPKKLEKLKAKLADIEAREELKRLEERLERTAKERRPQDLKVSSCCALKSSSDPPPSPLFLKILFLNKIS